ncbi:MAG: hypothetical protein RLP14_00035 [Owenweeksia sp.]
MQKSIGKTRSPPASHFMKNNKVGLDLKLHGVLGKTSGSFAQRIREFF